MNDLQNIYEYLNMADEAIKKCLEIIKQNPYIIKDIEDQTEDMALAAVNTNGLTLKYVKNQTIKVILAAFYQNVESIKYVNKSIRSIYDYEYSIYCKSVIELKYNLSKDIENHKQIDEKVQQLRLNFVNKIKNSSMLKLKFIENQTEELCIKFIKECAFNLFHVNNKTLEMYLIAIDSNPFILKYIDEKEQTEEMGLRAVKINGNVIKFVKNQTHKICMAALNQDARSYYFINFSTELIKLFYYTIARCKNSDIKKDAIEYEYKTIYHPETYDIPIGLGDSGCNPAWEENIRILISDNTKYFEEIEDYLLLKNYSNLIGYYIDFINRNY